MRKILLLIITIFLINACATSPKIIPSPDSKSTTSTTATSTSTSDKASTLNNEKNKSTQSDTPMAVTSPTTPPSLQAKKKVFALWIDSIGYDAFAALGFAQELEKKSIIIRKITGSGFGCWVALSWALEANGNQAEWQSFKWTQWDMNRANWLAKLKATDKKNAVIAEVKKLFPKDSISQMKLNSDCPVLESTPPYRVISGRAQKIPDLLWNHFSFPALSEDEERVATQEYLPAGMAGFLLPSEWRDFSQDISIDQNNEEFGGWIILRTRSSKEASLVNSKSNQPFWLISRSDRLYFDDPKVPRILVINLGNQNSRPSSDLSNIETRRRFLIQGRFEAQALLNNINSRISEFMLK